jgi:hypothetical protein
VVSQPYPLVTALQSLVANSKRKSSLTDQYDSLTSSAMYELYGIVGTMRSTLELLMTRNSMASQNARELTNCTHRERTG